MKITDEMRHRVQLGSMVGLWGIVLVGAVLAIYGITAPLVPMVYVFTVLLGVFGLACIGDELVIRDDHYL